MAHIQERSHIDMLAARVFQGHRQSESQIIRDDRQPSADDFRAPAGCYFFGLHDGLCYKSRE